MQLVRTYLQSVHRVHSLLLLFCVCSVRDKIVHFDGRTSAERINSIATAAPKIQKKIM